MEVIDGTFDLLVVASQLLPPGFKIVWLVMLGKHDASPNLDKTRPEQLGKG